MRNRIVVLILFPTICFGFTNTLPQALESAGNDTAAIVQWYHEPVTVGQQTNVVVEARNPRVVALEQRLLALCGLFGITNIVPGVFEVIAEQLQQQLATNPVQALALGLEMQAVRSQLTELGVSVYGVTGNALVTNVTVSPVTLPRWQLLGLDRAPTGHEIEEAQR